MRKLKTDLLKSDFSHVYVEKEVAKHPVTERILSKLSASKLVYINHHKDVFNRKNQSYAIQKNSRKLILAARKENFLYEGSRLCDSFGHDNFYYSTSIMNCIYNCEYCYLQGIYPSANLVIFVNLEDTFSYIRKLLKKNSIYLCVSYDTDLLGLELLTGFARMWIDFAKINPKALIEIRTKSSGFHLVSDCTPVPGFIFAWSLSPDHVISEYEKGTPDLDSRIKSINEAVKKGWRVRICIDPVLCYPGWQEDYRQMALYIRRNLLPGITEDISIGTFRVPSDCLKKMRKINPDSDILWYPYEKNKTDDVFALGEEKNKKIKVMIENILRGDKND